MTTLRFDAMPAMGAATLRALTARKSGPIPGELPELIAEVPAVRFEPQALRTFRKVCQVSERGVLPLTAPHVLAGPLHMVTLAHPSFPMPLMGLVHIDNQIVQHRPVPDDAPLDFTCRLGALTSDDKGQRFELITEARIAGELVWEETSGILRRAPSNGKKRSKRPTPPGGEDALPRRSVLWRVPADAGRRYAGVCGDYNPIHLSALSAKLFGYKRAIVHGMWSLARCLAEMPEEVQRLTDAGAVSLDARFKTPVFLPSHVAFHAYDDAEGIRFALRAADGVRPHLTGHLTPT